MLSPRNYRRGRTVEIKRISLKKMCHLVRKQQSEIYAVRESSLELKGMQVHKEISDLVEEYDDIFVDELPNELPPLREVDFEIDLKSDSPPPVRPVIRLFTNEIQELKRQVQTMRDKELIRPSSSPQRAPVFFVKKKTAIDDYRALNKIKIADSNPARLISEALDQVAGAKIFSQIDLIGAYHQMRIREKECHKTAIRTRFGAFEWRVVCFGLRNGPASFSTT